MLTSLASLISLQLQASVDAHTTTPVTSATPPLFLAQTTIPEGFEALSRPQRSLVDIYYGNRYLGSQLALYTPGTIEFSDPSRIVQLISDINDPVLITSALSGQLNTNTEQICITEGQNDCGILTPAVSGVIFDENRFRVDVFINRRFLATRSANVSKFLPPSDADYSFMQNFSAAVSGFESDNNTRSEDYTLSGISVFSKGENSLYTRWDYSKTQHLSIDSLYAQREFEGIHYRSGMMSSDGFGLSFSSDRPLLGVRIASSTRTRTDTGFSSGTPVEVFLPLRGVVEVRKDGRLVTSYFLEAGNQQLNTSAFPSGAYDIEIRILDDQGAVQSVENRFFAKEFDLPPEGELRHFMEAGKVMRYNATKPLPEITNQFIARAGISQRLTDTLATTVSAAINSKQSLVEFGLFNIGYIYEFSPSVMVGNNSAYGINLTGRLRFGEYTLNGNYRQLWNSQYEKKSEDDELNYPDLLSSPFRQSSLSINRSVYNGNISYRFSENASATNTAVTRTHTVGYRTSLYRVQEMDIDMDISFSQSGDNKVGLVSFNFRFRDDQWSWRANPRAEQRWNNDVHSRRERIRLSGTWNDGDLFDSTVRANVGVDAGTGDERYDARLELGNTWGQGNIALNHVVGENTVTNYAANFRSSFMTNGKQSAIGGENQANSALMINVEGKKNDTFDVVINGQRQGYAIAGRPSLIPLTPYQQYTVSLTPTGSQLYELDEKERTITLYPGNVVSMDYNATPLQLLFGRLLYNDTPLTGATINGGQQLVTSDDYGLFQMEISSDKTTIDVMLSNNTTCTLSLPEEENGIIRMGTVNISSDQCTETTIPNDNEPKIASK